MSSETDPVTTLADLRWNEQGLIPVVVQDNSTGEVLMMAWAMRKHCNTHWKRGKPLTGPGPDPNCGLKVLPLGTYNTLLLFFMIATPTLSCMS